jgi:hypothetical protein
MGIPGSTDDARPVGAGGAEQASGGVSPLESRAEAAVSGRAAILALVNKPLAFFALLLLVGELLLLALLPKINSDAVRNSLVIAVFLLLVGTAVAVLYMAIKFPSQLKGEAAPGAAAPAVAAAQGGPLAVPRGLAYCAASAQWATEGFGQDHAALKELFGRRVATDRGVTSQTLVNALTGERQYGLIHIVCHVRPDTGDLILGGFDYQEVWRTGRYPEGVDHVPVDGFVQLVRQHRPYLVVLATCTAVVLAAKLAAYTHVVAGVGEIDDERVGEWARIFYRQLARGRTLQEAFDAATATTKLTMLLLSRENFVLT